MGNDDHFPPPPMHTHPTTFGISSSDSSMKDSSPLEAPRWPPELGTRTEYLHLNGTGHICTCDFELLPCLHTRTHGRGHGQKKLYMWYYLPTNYLP